MIAANANDALEVPRVQAMVVTRFGDSDAMRVTEVPAPDPGPGEVSIDVEHAAVGLLDLLLRRGDLPGLVAPPFIPGLEVSGRIRSLGAGVSGFEVGERVVTLSRPAGGGYADVAVVDAALAIPIPDGAGVDSAAAVAMVPNLVTAIGALTVASPLCGGETLMVHGAAGGLASAFPPVARSLGASRIIGAVSSPDKLKSASGFGFDELALTSTSSTATRDLTSSSILSAEIAGPRASRC